MKRSILAILTICFLATTGAAMAQSSLNTTAPGPTTQREPGETNNNLPNPGNPIQRPTTSTTMAEPTNTMAQPEPMAEDQSTSSTGSMTDDVRAGATATGTAVQDATGTFDNDADTTETAAADDQATLPETASDMPLVALIGLLALGAAVVVRIKG